MYHLKDGFWEEKKEFAETYLENLFLVMKVVSGVIGVILLLLLGAWLVDSNFIVGIIYVIIIGTLLMTIADYIM